jgi:hypothetical protein
MRIRNAMLISGQRFQQPQARPGGSRRWLLRGIVLNLGFLAGLLFCSSCFAACSGSSPNFTAASASQSDIQACISLLSSNTPSTILVPAGTVSFGTAVNIPSTACVTINGQGAVTITSGTGFVINMGTSCESRVTGFTFTGGSSGPPSTATNIVVNANTQCGRVDHNTFTATGTQVFIVVYAPSVPFLIDHNTLSSGYSSGSASEDIHVYGYNAGVETGWTNNVTPGGPNMVFIEDNTVNDNQGNGGNVISFVESYFGSQTVVRYNTLNYSAQIDQHGTAGEVGARWWEIYDNQFNSNNYNQCCFITVRGGTGVIFDNHTDGSSTSGTSVFINLYDENGSSSSWPDEWQIGSGINGDTNSHNSCASGALNTAPAYVWGNDAFLTVGALGGASGTVVLGRDYFTSTNQPASMNWWEQSADSCSTTQAYTPYTYPHPLQGTQGTTVAAPSGLAAVVQQ